MPTYRPYTRVSDVPANTAGETTILEAHLDSAHGTITDVLEYMAQAVWSAGGVVIPGTVTNPSAALVRVQGRLGVTLDAKTLLAVADQSVDLAAVATGIKCLVVIRAKAGAMSAHSFVDAATGEPLTHNLLSSWGKGEVLEGDSSDYPALPNDCVPVARVTKTGATTLTLDSISTDAPVARVTGQPYDFELGFPGAPDAAATDLVLVPRDVRIPVADPGKVFVGTNPTDGTAEIAIEKNGSSVGTISITTGGTVTWTVASDIALATGDRLSIVAPSPADSSMADVLVAFRGGLA